MLETGERRCADYYQRIDTVESLSASLSFFQRLAASKMVLDLQLTCTSLEVSGTVNGESKAYSTNAWYYTACNTTNYVLHSKPSFLLRV